MKERLFSVILAGASLVTLVQAQVPQLLSYQGRVTVAGAGFTGSGQFKFALVSGDAATAFWSNDGTSVAGSEPGTAVSLPVTQGLFSVLLGDTSLSNMQAIAWTVFTNADVRMRLWFNDGTNGFAVLSPDQRLSAVGYAMMAANIPDGTITSNKLAPDSVGVGNIARGAVTSVQLATNSVTISAILNGAVTTAKLAPGAVTSANLAAGAVTAAKLGPGAVTTAGLASGAVTAGKLAPGAVTGPAIADGTISQAKLDFELGYLNAKNPPYGAKGDGAADDTAAVQSALNDAAANGGGIVFLPRGNYRILTHLVVPAQTTLAGVWRAPTAAAQYRGTTLLALEGAGSTSGVPFITLQGNNSTLEGVSVYYPNQVTTNPPIPYPWAVRGGGGENVTVQNVLLVNPYLGIDLATYPSARHLVRGVYGQPLLVGIAVDQCYDIGRIMDIHFWPFWTLDNRMQVFQSANAVSFDFMRTDWEVVQDVFSWGYYIGARFRASAHGGMNGQMSNINFDNVDIGLHLTATQPYAVHISNLNIANAGGGTHHIGIQALPGASDLNVNGASFWGSIRQPVSWGSTGLLTFSSARMLGWDASVPAVAILAGRAILQGNYFTDNVGTAILVGPATDRVMITGNELAGNGLSLLGPRTLSANNHP
ncbi:MAG TPA: glycosyl hydrolase family 28-related protein [Verrucomicrobiae bacterium]